VSRERSCPAITAQGKSCQGYVHPGKEYCPAHDPARAEARRRAASKAGRSRTGSEIAEVKAELRQLAKDVRASEVTPGVGSVVSQVLGTFLKACEAEARLRETSVREGELALKIHEQEELEARLEALESLLQDRKEDRQWGT
jgi:hypothetical protein